MKRSQKTTGGFTLLELLAVVTIIGILAATVMSRISTQAYDAKKKCCLQYKRDMNAALERYHFDHGTYPAQLDDLCPDYYPDVLPVCPITNQAYDVDSLNHWIQGHNH